MTSMNAIPILSKSAQSQRGFVLISSLLMLVILTLLAVSMFRSFGLHERIAGNLREKTRAFDAAQATLSYGEWWLAQPGNAFPGGITCTTISASTPVICSNALTSPTATTWLGGIYYRPSVIPAASISAAGGLSTYYKVPQLYIQYLGPGPNSAGLYYRITALAYGGNASTVVVLQSTFVVNNGSTGAGGP